ncbi:MAG: hydroxymethylbilane synthase [Gemmataceae bacterium]
MNRVRIGTRSSPLALWQARHVAEHLTPLAAPLPVELVLIETEGDRIRDRPLSQIGGDGLFTKEIQNALLDGRADVAVHSLKDLPTFIVPELALAAVPPRAPVGDAFLSRRHRCFADLPLAARVGTSSLRRKAQLLHRRPDLRIDVLRGNVETRLRKLDDEGFDAIILAEAGLRRLGLEQHITEILDREWMLPAVGQGALGLECRSDDAATLALLQPLNDPATRAAVLAEREFLRSLGGGCLVPFGALGEVTDQGLNLRGAVLPVDGTSRISGQVTGPLADAEPLGRQLALSLLDQGARDLLPRSG